LVASGGSRPFTLHLDLLRAVFRFTLTTSMRWRAIAAVSLIVNAVIAVIFFLSWQPGKSRSLASSAQAASNLPARTNVVVRRQFFSWKEVESPDYPTYIANLRDIGCPDQTIRDIIIADVNSLYAQK